MFEEENQMGLFEIDTPAPQPVARDGHPASAAPAAPVKPANPVNIPATKLAPAPASKTTPAQPSAKPARVKAKTPARAVPPQPAKKVSGLVPEGDVRLTANIRQDLHLKLKIASAHRRTTIGEIIEELIEEYL